MTFSGSHGDFVFILLYYSSPSFLIRWLLQMCLCLSWLHVTLGIQVIFPHGYAQSPPPPFTLLVCFCLSPVNNNTQGVHRCKKVTAMLKEEKMGGKKIEDERKESRRVTLLKSITCQFTAVAPWTALYKFPVWHPFLLLPSRLGLRPTRSPPQTHTWKT